MPPRKKEADDRLSVDTQAFIGSFVRSNDFEVSLRPGCGKVVSISPITGLADRHKLGYSRLMADEIELLDGDSMYPTEKDYGMYWFETDDNGFAILSASTGEIHYILAMDKDRRDSRIEAIRRYEAGKTDNVDDKGHAKALSQNLARGSSYEAEEEITEATMKL